MGTFLFVLPDTPAVLRLPLSASAYRRRGSVVMRVVPWSGLPRTFLSTPTVPHLYLLVKFLGSPLPERDRCPMGDTLT